MSAQRSVRHLPALDAFEVCAVSIFICHYGGGQVTPCFCSLRGIDHSVGQRYRYSSTVGLLDQWNLGIRWQQGW